MPTELHLGGLLKPTYWKRYKMPNLIPRPSSMPQSTLNNSYSVCRAPASQPAATDDPPPFSTLPLPPPHPLRGVGRLVPHIYSPYIVWLCFQGLSCKQQLLLLTDCPLPLNHTVFITTYYTHKYKSQSTSVSSPHFMTFISIILGRLYIRCKGIRPINIPSSCSLLRHSSEAMIFQPSVI
jgi:hypothetical protein